MKKLLVVLCAVFVAFMFSTAIFADKPAEKKVEKKEDACPKKCADAKVACDKNAKTAAEKKKYRSKRRSA